MTRDITSSLHYRLVCLNIRAFPLRFSWNLSTQEENQQRKNRGSVPNCESSDRTRDICSNWKSEEINYECYSLMSSCVQLVVTPWTVAHQAPWKLNLSCTSCINRWILYHWATREAPILHFILAKRQRSEKFSKHSMKNDVAGFHRKAFCVASLGTGYVCDSSSKFEHVQYPQIL